LLLCGCETWSVTQGRGVQELGLEKGSGRRWVGLHSEGLHDLGCSQGINWGGQLKQHAICRARVCRREMHTGSGEKTWSKEKLIDLGIDGSMILKWILTD